MAGLIAPVARLIEEFSKLPGVGTKTAQRLTYHVLRASTDDARALAAALVAIKEEVAYCSVCCNITEAGVDPCDICADPRRETTAHLRRRGAARRAGHRAHRRVPWPLPRPPRRDQPDRRHRSGAAPHPRAARPGRRAAGSRRSSSPPTRTSRARRRRCTSPTCSAPHVAERDAHRARPAGRRRPRVRRRRDPHPLAPGPPRRRALTIPADLPCALGAFGELPVAAVGT